MLADKRPGDLTIIITVYIDSIKHAGSFYVEISTDVIMPSIVTIERGGPLRKIGDPRKIYISDHIFM